MRKLYDSTKSKTIDFTFLYLIVIGYVMISLILTVLLMKPKPIKVFLLTLFFTAIGMGFRYVLGTAKYI